MRDLRELNKWREREDTLSVVIGSADDDEEALRGTFRFQHKGQHMLVIATTGLGWDHVSVSFPTRCPTWDEMEWVKRKFFRDDETAMQLHVPPSDHVSMHSYALHLWRPNDGVEIPRPPGIMVGLKGVTLA